MMNASTMPLIFRKKILILQLALWTLLFFLLLFLALHKTGFTSFSFCITVSLTFFYALCAYGNASWLLPRFYKKNLLLYASSSLLFLAAVTFIRTSFELKLLYPFFSRPLAGRPSYYYFNLTTNFIAFFFGALIRILIDYFKLLQKQQSMQYQQTKAELNLLKAQVQPHFLFNTLNNIYSLAYAKSDQTTHVISKLSEIMRYFVDEAPKERVTLQTELKFLYNYIELEKIRMPYPVTLRLHIDADQNLMIPPMLFITFIENIFKHGIDKTLPLNNASISLEQQNDMLVFCTRNTLAFIATPEESGVGLANLRQRLQLLYGEQYELQTALTDDIFTAQLKIPLS